MNDAKSKPESTAKNHELQGMVIRHEIKCSVIKLDRGDTIIAYHSQGLSGLPGSRVRVLWHEEKFVVVAVKQELVF